MPVETRINVPFIPQEGITSQVLAAIQMANEQHARQQGIGIQQQQLKMQQAAQPSLIAHQEAETAQAQAGAAKESAQTELLPQQFQVEKEMKEATLASVVEQRKFNQMMSERMFGLKTKQEDWKEFIDQGKLTDEQNKTAIMSKWRAAEAQGLASLTMQRQESITQRGQLGNQANQLRAQGNTLRQQGNENAAYALELAATRIDNQIGAMQEAEMQFGFRPGGTAPKRTAPNQTPAATPSLQNPY